MEEEALELLEEEALDIDLEGHHSWGIGYDVTGRGAPTLKGIKEKNSSSSRKRKWNDDQGKEETTTPIKVEIKHEPAEYEEENTTTMPPGMVKRVHERPKSYLLS